MACLALAAGLGAPAIAADPGARGTLLVAAPGYPSTSEQAQPTMDAFARAVERAAGWAPDALVARYVPELGEAVERLSHDEATLALVPLPFYLQFRGPVGLKPLAAVTQRPGPDEVWTLVARRGTVKAPGDLEGWTVAGLPGYSAGFVRDVALANWGELPAGTAIDFEPRVLAALRRAAEGEPVVVLLDRAQSGALESLPFATELETVTRSRPVPGSLLCTVRDSLDRPAERRALLKGLMELHHGDGGETLATMRIERFQHIEPERLAALERATAPGAAGR